MTNFEETIFQISLGALSDPRRKSVRGALYTIHIPAAIPFIGITVPLCLCPSADKE